jgi:hypothetical protein
MSDFVIHSVPLQSHLTDQPWNLEVSMNICFHLTAPPSDCQWESFLTTVVCCTSRGLNSLTDSHAARSLRSKPCVILPSVQITQWVHARMLHTDRNDPLDSRIVINHGKNKGNCNSYKALSFRLKGKCQGSHRQKDHSSKSEA